MTAARRAMDLDEQTPGHCILPDASRTRVLLVAAQSHSATGGGGAWSLPAVRANEEWWSPNWLGRIVGQVRAALGADVTVLRHLRGAPLWVLELENHTAEWEPPESARWVGRDELDAIPLAPPGVRTPLESWFAEAAGGWVSPLRPPWERPGWLRQATSWIGEQLERLGETAAGPVRAVKGAWYVSCVLRVPTARGAVYFKAHRALPPSEPALVAALAARWPDRVPRLVAVDAPRRWMLARDFGRDVLESDYDRPPAPLGRWEAAVRSFAQLQVEAAAHVDEWLALGCDDWRGTRLARRLEALLDDDRAVGRGESWGLSAAEGDRLRHLLPRVGELCAALASAGVPDSLVHPDFSGRNMVRTERGFVFYDWGEAAVGHPFFSGTTLAHEVRYPVDEHVPGPSGVPSVIALTGRARQRLIADAYLAPWRPYASAGRLSATFAAASKLRSVWRAVRAGRELPSLESSSPWAHDLARSIPAELRDVLAEFAE